MKRLLAVTTAVALAVGALAPRTIAAPTQRAVLTGVDALVATGVPSTLRFKVERDNSSRYNLWNVKVDFYVNGSKIGSALSKCDGYARLSFATPSSPGDLVVTGRLAAGGTYTAADNTLLVCVRNGSERVFVTDVDQTISAATWSQVTQKSNSQLYPLPGAVEGITDIARDATIVYLTARGDSYRAKTRDWLERWGFPRGPMFCQDPDQSTSTRWYKSGVLRGIKPYFPNMTAGTGNKDTDAQAYNDNGMRSAMFTTQTTSFPSHAFVCDGWDELRAANAQGKTSFLSWATSFR